MTMIREPAVAGSFYPGEAGQLDRAVASLLRDAHAASGPAPKALIVPHAGYIYSGPVAASAYARLGAYRNRYRRVVLIGPGHRVPVAGVALSGADVFRTPLGDVPLDTNAIAALASPHARVFDHAHVFEHSLEVQLPFLQTVLGDFALVPIVVGDAAVETVADVLDQLWDGPETLIVVSSDLSHYLAYEQARVADDRTRDAIEALDPANVDHRAACGATPIGGLLLVAQRHDLRVATLDLRNSGDTAGNADRVVGYGAWMFNEQ